MKLLDFMYVCEVLDIITSSHLLFAIIIFTGLSKFLKPVARWKIDWNYHSDVTNKSGKKFRLASFVVVDI